MSENEEEISASEVVAPSICDGVVPASAVVDPSSGDGVVPASAVVDPSSGDSVVFASAVVDPSSGDSVVAAVACETKAEARKTRKAILKKCREVKAYTSRLCDAWGVVLEARANLPKRARTV